ncbi:Hpt domain-containing protein [Marinicellulosiphila megalodicopiae]|uniref:Hpt domain-containing protein n=1 Tax=Marinicellulosiphila megalodicopiae TaxID=2724896 RepID=UPI003BAF4539
MADRHDYVALEWVKGEIESTLDLARQALESYVEDTHDSTQLGFCFNYLHQVNGTLKMVEFYGAALLSEELEKLAQKMVDQSVVATEENMSILMQGIIQLPNYLDKVKAHHQDLPIVLLPIINEIRSACHEELFSASALFQPDLTESTKALPAVSANFNKDQFLGLAKKLRQMYQVALLGLLKNQEIEKNLAYLEKVMGHLVKHCTNTPMAIYWSVVQAMIVGLQEGSIELGATTKEILKHVDSTIKHVTEKGAAGLSVNVSEEQLKNALFYIAKAQSDQPHIQTIKKIYRLNEALPHIDGYTNDNAMAGPDKDAMHSVIKALTEETSKIKEQIELLATTGSTLEDVTSVKEAIKPIGDTLAALGMSELRKVLLDQHLVLEKAEQNATKLTDQELMEMAGGLLFVESSMKGEISHADGAPVSMIEGVSDAQNAVIREARNGLEQTKDAIVEYIGSQWDIEKIEEVPQTLKAIGGGLSMIPLQKVSNILDACERYFSENLIENKQVPQWSELDQLADALMGIEYYLERLTQDGQGSNESLLDTSQERMESLGMQVAACDPIVETPKEDQNSVEQALPVLDTLVETEESEITETETPVESTENEIIAPISLKSEQNTSIENEDNTDDDDLIDDEILEIFVEEAHEVLEAIHEFLPKYKANQEDKESLTEFRRAFHTLKGSGRMVGAKDIGELAWSIESMLNTHIEGNTPYSDALIELVEDVTEYVPTLIHQFEKQQQADLATIEKLVDRATVIVKGEAQSAVEPELEITENPVSDVDSQIPTLEPFMEEDSSLEQNDEPELSIDLEQIPTIEVEAIEEGAPVELEILLDEVDDSSGENETNGSVELELEPILEDTVEPEILITDEMLGINDEGRSEKIQSEDPEFVKFEIDEDAVDSLFSGDFSEEIEIDSESAQSDESDFDIVLDEDIQPEVIEFSLETIDEIALDPSESQNEEEQSIEFSIDQESTENEQLADDERIYAIFKEELLSHINVLNDFIEGGPDQILSEELQRAFHTIKGASHMAGVVQLAEAISPVEKLVQTMHQLHVQSNAEIFNVINEATQRCEQAINDISSCLESDESSQQFAAYVYEIMQRHVDLNSNQIEINEDNPLQIFLNATMDVILDSEELTALWSEKPITQNYLQQIASNMQQLVEHSQIAQQPVFASLGQKLCELYQSDFDQITSMSERFIKIAQQGQEALVNLMDRIAAAQKVEPQLDIEQQIDQLLEIGQLDDSDGDTAGIEFSIEETPVEIESTKSSTYKRSFTVSADDDLVEIFIEEANELVESVRQLLDIWQKDTEDTSIVEQLQRDLHTLKGGARMAEIRPLGDLAHEIEFLYEGICDGRYAADESVFELLFACQDDISDMVQDIEAQGKCEYDPELVGKIKEYCDSHKVDHLAKNADELSVIDEPDLHDTELSLVDESDIQINESGIISQDEMFIVDSDPELIEIFLDEADEILVSIQAQFDTWKQDISNLEPVHILQRDLHTLKGGARMAGISPIGDLGHELEYLYEGFVNHKYVADDSLIELIESCHNSLSDMVQDIQNTMQCKNDRFLLECVQNYCAGNGFNIAVNDHSNIDDQSQSLMDIFVEETQGLLGQLTQARLAWRYTPKDVEQSDIIKRILHTVRGGANLAEQEELAQLAGNIEQFAIDTDQNTKDDAYFDQLDEKLINLETLAVNVINAHIHNQSDQSNSQGFDNQINEWVTGEASDNIENISLEQSISDDFKESASESDYDNVIEFDSSVLSDIKMAMEPKTAMDIADEAKRMAGEQEASDKKRRGQNQETVKVQATMLDGLVNLAGETSISRARLEQELADFNFTLSEMNFAIDRMNEQIRRLDNETQEQVAYRQEQAEEELEEFDPLEMDRYSSIQQLSRSIMESASDLMDLQDTLKERTRDTETILLQQSRINTELQEGLMQTRMVPFSGIAPRLRRIVRQTAGELKKKAELEFFNVEGEVDRTVLERMVAPLEHMLRNSMDHGIEMPDVRAKAGKSKTGKVELSLAREGSYMVLTLRDDGAGINIDRIREKAVEKGLMKEDANLTDQEILMFILDAGFSTADKITQISGRGVGMDVVNSEVKQLGGVMTINSTVGEGTLFRIRIPVTVSLSRALMVSIGDDTYALPLNSIEGIVRVSPAQMQQFYQPDAPKFRYSGKDYRVQYLGSLMDETLPAHIPSDATAIPLILVHGVDNDHTLALHVDQLLGSREIVVKAIGPQFTSVTGLTGATILGDGSVVVILDLPSMIRSAIATDAQIGSALQIGAPEKQQTEERAMKVMVVDDSVTVRKVTSRLLERNGYEVILAKDGQDAVTQLQDVRPDIMLLDIEMPRMDGFEVATRVRHNPEISDLPIIMITSRTGEKHKERAMSIGVNEYLGKPFQEGPLLETIKEQLEMAKTQ